TFGRRKFFSRCACCEPAPTFGTTINRRNFLSGGAAALGLGLSAAATPATAQAPAKRRIDVHHHIVPPAQAAALTTGRSTNPPRWSVAMSLDDMEKGGVATSITSVVNPGVWFGKVDEASRK